MPAQPLALSSPLVRCSVSMVVFGALFGFLPIVNGLLAGIIGGRQAGTASMALKGVGLAAIPLTLIVGVILMFTAPAVAPHWLITTIVTLVIGALAGGAASAAECRAAVSRA